MTETIPVKYIGPDAFWHGTLYGVKLRFEHGQTLDLPTPLALKFVTHHDTFAKGNGPAKAPTPEEAADQALAEAKKTQELEEQQRNEAHDLFAQIDLMDKTSLAEFCNRYGQVLDKRKNVDTLRAEAKSFVDRFGPA